MTDHIPNPEAGSSATIPSSGIYPAIPAHRIYSQTAILVSTFFAGPLAAGIMMRRNFINLGQKPKGNSILLICLALIFTLGFIFWLIDGLVDDRLISNLVSPLSSFCVYFFIRETMSERIEGHKKSGGRFFPFFRSFGVAIASLVVSMAIYIGMAFMLPDTSEDKRLEEIEILIDRNEVRALELFSLLEKDVSRQFCIDFIDNTALPLWHENKMLIAEMEGLLNNIALTMLKGHVNGLKEYTDLRITEYGLIKQILAGDESEATISDWNSVEEKIARHTLP